MAPLWKRQHLLIFVPEIMFSTASL